MLFKEQDFLQLFGKIMKVTLYNKLRNYAHVGMLFSYIYTMWFYNNAHEYTLDSKIVGMSLASIIISIVLGLGIASLFRKVCKDRSCIAFRAPPLKDLENDTYKLDDKCYQYKTNAVKCDPSKKEVKMN